MTITREPLVIFHANCPDGYGSAWWLGQHLGNHQKWPAFYDKPAPDTTGRVVYMVDFCYKADELTRIADTCNSLLILDHHASQLAEVRSVMAIGMMTSIEQWRQEGWGGDEPRCGAVMDVSRSGVGLTAEYVAQRFGVSAPDWFANIEDRDLWHFKERRTQAVFAAVTARRYTESDWDQMGKLSASQLAAEGAGVEMYRQRLIEATLETAHRMEIAGYEVWAAASPYAICSDVAGELAKREPDMFGATYVTYSLDPLKLKLSLRSTEQGMDVSKIAQSIDPTGGGHVHAAGARLG